MDGHVGWHSGDQMKQKEVGQAQEVHRHGCTGTTRRGVDPTLDEWRLKKKRVG